MHRATRRCPGDDQDGEPAAVRREKRTKRFCAKDRKRVKLEHRISPLVKLGSQQARYIGSKKLAFQIAMGATVANLTLAMSASGSDGLMRALPPLFVLAAACALRALRPQFPFKNRIERIGNRLVDAMGPRMARSWPGL